MGARAGWVRAQKTGVSVKARYLVETENAAIEVESCSSAGLSMLVDSNMRSVRVTFETAAQVDDLIKALERARGRE